MAQVLQGRLGAQGVTGAPPPPPRTLPPGRSAPLLSAPHTCAGALPGHLSELHWCHWHQLRTELQRPGHLLSEVTF